MSRVVFHDTEKGLDKAVAGIFSIFGGGRALLKSSNKVFIKVNGIDAKPYVYTSPKVVEALIKYFHEQGAGKVYIIENSTQGTITRLVFELTGMRRVCQKTGAIPIFLDETGKMPLFLPGLKNFVDISDFVHNHLIIHRKENLYISMPKLKTHSMTTVTLGIKNQFGFIHHNSRIYDHNFNLHQKVADIFANIQPDFTLIDGLEATNFGHYPPEAQKSKTIIPLNLLIGGNDTMAVDVASARFLGFKLKEVEHLSCADEYKLGESNFAKIRIVNQSLFDQRKQSCSCDILGKFPVDILFLRGETRCCKEGCKRNTEAVLEILSQDYGGQGGFSILMGKDIKAEDIARLKGPIHIAGDCAIGDWFIQLRSRLGNRNITCSPGCNNLAATIEGLTRWTKVHPSKLARGRTMKVLKTLLQAKLHGTNANIPALF